MITKNIKSKILENITKKEEKILVSNILDKVLRFENNNTLEFTHFLDLNEIDIIKKVLDYLKINYFIAKPNLYAEKQAVFFIPDYLEFNTNKVISDNISCIKIIPPIKGKLLHKDYMGSIYSLGIKHEMIGDIMAFDSCAYVFVMNTVKKFILDNLIKVKNQNVILELVDLSRDEVLNLSYNFTEKEYIVCSKRIDAILSSVYNLSRNQVKEKINSGDLYINSKNTFYITDNLKKGDIVSFKRCGKFVFDDVVRETKNKNIVIKIKKYS